MPIVQPQLTAESLNGAVSKAFTRTGSTPIVTPGQVLPSGAGSAFFADWAYRAGPPRPRPGVFQVDGMAGRLDQIQRIFIAAEDATQVSQSAELMAVAHGQNIDIGGVPGVVAGMSVWNWHGRRFHLENLWQREANQYICYSLVMPMDLHLLEEVGYYTITFS